jgi:hypothetical protein
MRTKLLVYTLIGALVAMTTGCPRIHSPAQEELAHDVQERYKTLTPSALQALEALDTDLEKLIESQRADFEIYKETSESLLVTTTWAKLKKELAEMENKYGPKPGEDAAAPPDCAQLAAQLENDTTAMSRKDIVDLITCEQTTLKGLGTQSGELADAIKKLNKGLKEAEKMPTLQEQLNETKRVINATVTALDATLKKAQADPASPISERLSITVKGLNDFLTEVNDKPEQTQRVFSLVVEAMRLGRDIAVLEREVVEQESSYHENVIGLLTAKLNIFPDSNALKTARQCFDKRKYPDDERVQERIARLAYEAGIGEEVTAEKIVENYKRELVSGGKPMDTPAPPSILDCDADNPLLSLEEQQKLRITKAGELRYILEQLALVQSVRLTNAMRMQELELRLKAEKFRNTKLKEAIFERQRMTLVSFGLVGVVRYAEGGLRSEDIANLINIARAIAEGVIAARI